MRIVEIVFTGGPCAGKTTSLVTVTTALREHGWRVLVVPEAATMYITGGVSDIGEVMSSDAIRPAFQTALCLTQTALRERYQAMAEALGDEKVAILYDRAESDNAAYVSPEEFSRVLADAGLDYSSARDSYDLVVHLVTAADGAEEAYTTENNAARRETPAEARALDRRTLAAWTGHPNLVVVGNEGSFAQKVAHVTRLVLAHCGEEHAETFQRKFLVSPLSPAHLAELGAVTLEIEQHYVTASADAELRVRRHTQAGASTYTRTRKRRLPSGGEVKQTAFITPAEYAALAAASESAPVRKLRHTFVVGTQRFELDEFLSPSVGWVLEASLEENQSLTLPFEVLEEVTGQRRWTNASLAAA